MAYFHKIHYRESLRQSELLLGPFKLGTSIHDYGRIVLLPVRKPATWLGLFFPLIVMFSVSWRITFNYFHWNEFC